MADPYSPAAIDMYRQQADASPYGAKALAYYQGRPYISNELPIGQLVQYQQGKAQAKLGYETGTAQNAYEKAASTAKYNLGRGQAVRGYEEFTLPNLENKYAQQRSQLSGPFAGRGMLNSGMHEGAKTQFQFEKSQGLGQAAFEQQNTLGNLDTDYLLQQGQYNINAQNLARTYWEATAQLNQQEQAARYDLAAQIRAFA